MGLAAVPVPHASQGLDLDALEREILAARASGALREPAAEGDFAAALYLVPSHHNPTGATLPLEGRRRLISLAREHPTAASPGFSASTCAMKAWRRWQTPSTASPVCRPTTGGCETEAV